MQKRWSKAEITHLKRHVATQSVEELAQRLRTDAETVRRKLEEMGLTTEPQTATVDEALEVYSRALELLHGREWSEAAALFEKVAAESDSRELAARARQNLAVCRRNTDETTGGDPYLLAVYEKNRGNLEAALNLCLEEGKDAEDERYAYLVASLKALQGDVEAAFTHLETAIRLEPRNRIHAYHDPDFEEVRGEEGFQGLLTAPES